MVFEKTSSKNMDNYKIEKTTKLQDLDKIILEGHVQDEKNKGIICNYKPFALVLKHQDNIIGALQAYTAFAEIYVDDIWVKPEYRGNGLGRRLLENLEEEFMGKGYNNINLVTSHFQAPEFYKKCGFEVEFVRNNKVNPLLSKTFFVKYFKDQNQYQGVLKDND